MLKFKTGDWIRVICIFFTIVVTYAYIVVNVNTNSEAIAKQEPRIQKNNDLSIGNQQNVGYIIKSIDVIQADVKELLKR